MNRYFLSTLLTFWFFTAVPQQTKCELGNITRSDFEVDCLEESESSAIVLFDCGNSIFFEHNGGMDIEFTRTKRIKVKDLKDESLFNVEIPYYHDGYGKSEKVTDVVAYSYHLEGNKIVKTELAKSEVFEVEYNKKWSALKFTFPNVTEGAILEYQYRHITPFKMNLPDWEFQSDIPTLYSEYKVAMVPFYEYVQILQGYDGIKQIEVSEGTKGDKKSFYGIDYHEMRYKLKAENVPAFRDESFITSKKHYILKANFQLAKIFHFSGAKEEFLSTWQKLADDLVKSENFGRYIKKSEKDGQADLAEIGAFSEKSDLEKVQAITSHIKKKYTWNGFHGVYSGNRPKELLQNKNGSAAAINLYLIGLLRSAGLNANPVILSTRKHGPIYQEYPFLDFFNYVIASVVVGDYLLLLDGTDSDTPYDRIPQRCINGQGLMVDLENLGWIDLYPNSLSKRMISKTITLDVESGHEKIAGLIDNQEYYAYKLKGNYQDDKDELKRWIRRHGYDSIQNIETKGYDNPLKPYVINFEGSRGLKEVAGNYIISPFSDFGETKNKLTSDNRSYPVDLVFATSNVFSVTIDLPQGYQLTGDVSPINKRNAVGSYSLQAMQNGNKVSFFFRYKFNKPIYAPSEYQDLKGFYAGLVELSNKEFVFKKVL